MIRFSPYQLCNILEGKILTWPFGRTVQIFTTKPDDEPLPNSLYFLFGGVDDEDQLLNTLVENHTTGVVIKENHHLDIEKWKRAGIGVIEVSRIIGPYIELSKIYRSQFSMPLVQVIGSSGKTTTKEMIGSVLNEGMDALVSCGNYNSPAGIAYNLFLLRNKHRAAVFEAGMNGFGTMGVSTGIIKPDIVVVTSIHRSHFLRLGSISNIISAKAEALEHLSPKGTLIINGDDENCRRFPIYRFHGKVLRFGFTRNNDIWASDIMCRNFRTYFRARGRDFDADCTINIVGKYNVSNALAAILAGKELGLNSDEIVKGLSQFEPVCSRLRIYKGIKESVLIDDNFNANPDSTRLLVDEIPEFAGGRPVVLVIGDMERPDDKIREYAEEVHQMVGERIACAKVDYLIAVGKWAGEYIRGAVRQGFSRYRTVHFGTVEEAEKYIKDYVIPGGIMIFKASVYTRVGNMIKNLQYQ